MSLNPEDPRPVSQQIADLLQAAIADGTLGPGERVDSIRKLATRFGVSPQAADNALGILKAKGLTYTNVGRGTFVREEAGGVLAATERSPEFVAISSRLDQLFTVIESISDRVAALEDGSTSSIRNGSPAE